MIVSGHTEAKYGVANNGTVTVDLKQALQGLLPANVDTTKVKVSVNGNVLLAAAYTIAFSAANKNAVVTCKQAAGWPNGCNVVVEFAYKVTTADNPNFFAPEDWLTLIPTAAPTVAPAVVTP